MASKEVIVARHKTSILVSGTTFHIKDTLKGLGGRWNKSLQGCK